MQGLGTWQGLAKPVDAGGSVSGIHKDRSSSPRSQKANRKFAPVPRMVALHWNPQSLILTGIGLFVRNQSIRWTQTAATRKHFADCEAFVKAHPDIFRSGNEIIVADDVYGDTAFFYPLLRSGARPWFRGTKTLAATSDEEKLNPIAAFRWFTPRLKTVLHEISAP